MSVVEVLIRIIDIGDAEDIETIQDNVSDALYEHGYTRFEPVQVRLVPEDIS